MRRSRSERGSALVIRAVSRTREFDVGEFPLGGNHVKVGCKPASFGAVSRAAITASTVIDAIRISRASRVSFAQFKPDGMSGSPLADRGAIDGHAMRGHIFDPGFCNGSALCGSNAS